MISQETYDKDCCYKDMFLDVEDLDYLSKQLITYIGNKRLLLSHIQNAVVKAKKRTGKSHLRIFDAFSGSGIVSRLMKSNASYLASNDFEDYAASIARCYLRNRSSVNMKVLSQIIKNINSRVNGHFPEGFIEKLYSPQNELNITHYDRVFYTKDNARRLDNYRRMFEDYPLEFRDLLLGPLLSKASIHSNTSGVFKGFYKNKDTGIGQYGGTNSNALSRIKGKIELELPILSRFECDCDVFHDDTNKIVDEIKNLDLVYIDPPYNQHPYGSNYFMLNLIVHYKDPENISRVSGIPKNWKRSGYNVKSKSKELFNHLLHTTDTRFFLISFNNEGFITPEEMRSMLKKIGNVDEVEISYNTFRGARNLRSRNIHVTEQLFFVERKTNVK